MLGENTQQDSEQAQGLPLGPERLLGELVGADSPRDEVMLLSAFASVGITPTLL
jgi:hypothetical protein